MNGIYPDWKPGAACVLAVPVAVVVGAVYVWMDAALPALALVAGVAALVGYVGGPNAAPIAGLVLGMSLPASVTAAAMLGLRVPHEAWWMADGLVPILLATTAAYGGAVWRWAAHQWGVARQVR